MVTLEEGGVGVGDGDVIDDGGVRGNTTTEVVYESG